MGVYVRGVRSRTCMQVYRDQRVTLGVLVHRSQPYALETGSLVEPGARLEGSKPQ